MSAADELAAKWQQKLDRDFPRGLLATWDDISGADGGPRYAYLCPRAEVTGMHGLDPVVMLPVPDWDKVVQPGAIASYVPVTASPPAFRVTFADGRSMTWGAGINEAQAAACADHRQDAMRLSAQLGRSAWTPPPDEGPGEP